MLVHSQGLSRGGKDGGCSVENAALPRDGVRELVWAGVRAGASGSAEICL